MIAGIYRSRILAAPPGSATRPTSDRLRETLFNILAPRIQNCRFADLYAGTGAVGIEALSRGAAQVWFAESLSAALKSLRGNLAALSIHQHFTVDESGVASLLQRLDQQQKRLDVAFLDPPYEAANEYDETLGFFGSGRGSKILTDDASVIAEHSSKAPLSSRYGLLEQYRSLKQGDATLSFYRSTQKRDDAPGAD